MPKSEGYCMPGGPIEARALPYPIGVGVQHVAPLPPRPVKEPATPVDMARRQREVCEAYLSGALVRVIANQHGISRTRVYGLLKDGGIATRKDSE